ncbi:MAG: alkaline phosphatase family protein [Candidatus Polarisedimenticolia bacterium]
MRSRMAARLIPALFLAAAASVPAAAAAPSRVVIIGFDGADARLVEQYMAEGRLPNLSRLKEEGSYAELTPTNPPQTPVSWSAFATGKNPGKTGVFDFLKRAGNNYLPTLAFTTETRRPLLWGPRNAMGLAAIGVLAGLLIGAGFPLLFRARRMVAMGMGLLAAAALGWGGYQMGAVWLPEAVPWAVNNRQGRTLWEMVASHGGAAQVIRVPQNFPAESIEGGRVLCGLGVPDMRGRVGTPSFYTSEPGFQVTDNEFSVEVIPLEGKSGRVTSALYGPLNLPFHQYPIDDAKAAASPQDRERIAADMERELEERGIPKRLDLPVSFTVSEDASSVTIEVQGQTVKLRVGEWSDWHVLKFPVNWLVDMAQPLRGIVRWKVLSTRPELKIYQTPVNFHPECQPIPFSFPGSFASDLQQHLGFFKTLGWAEDTWTLPTGLVPDEFFVEDMNRTVDSFEAMMEAQLSSSQDRLYVQVFDFVDRIGHMFWRYLDTKHPFHDPMNDPAHVEAMSGALRSAYERMDRIVGRARELAGKDALFFVMSDHGFGSFRRGMNYNTWLVKNGFMTLKSDRRTGKPKTLQDLFETRRFFEDVDWSKTQAYALGLGGIYINVAGRERDGVVQPGEDYERVRSAIIAGLEATVDPHTGERAVQKVYKREEMYTGYDPTLIPDLRAANTLGYRIGWQSALGEVPREIFEDNLKAWSGDHCSLDPELVKGILFVNRPITRDGLNIVDVMPTVLKAMEIEIPEDVDGRPFL